ncbi:hypothetical protein BPC006_I3207 [Burkholderia pseudomallei BPC006]|nr:hypothetical protein BPC006_I3207 [Burkholderia pseudomallei BPC006]
MGRLVDHEPFHVHGANAAARSRRVRKTTSDGKVA